MLIPWMWVKYANGILLNLLLLVTNAGGFSLLGPYTDWMQMTNGYRLQGDIGGPMDLGEEYRWNVPVVTYGFDQAFLDYFGSNGVAAVEEAIQILNALPPASELNLTNYPTHVQQDNPAAAAESLYDLKSMALSLLVEQLGLAEATRNIYTVARTADPAIMEIIYYWLPGSEAWSEWVIPEYIVLRNFDPGSVTSTNVVNDTICGASLNKILIFTPTGSFITFNAAEFAVLADPPDAQPKFLTVSDWKDNSFAYRGFMWAEWRRSIYAGGYFNSLTRDDVGGLRYLLRSNNINFELLLPDVRGSGTNADAFVNGAFRPGVEKITLVRHPFDPVLGAALPMTNYFVDTYVTNNQVKHQELVRITDRPDILFRVEGDARYPQYERSSTAHWRNHAALNGDSGKAGPGVISPPIEISFKKPESWILTWGYSGYWGLSEVGNYGWGTFHDSTNSVIRYPQGERSERTIYRLQFLSGWLPSDVWLWSHEWKVPDSPGQTVQLQMSTNLVDWVTIQTFDSPGGLTNHTGIVNWYHQGWTRTQEYFRVLAQ